ncbi:antibiotic biosynthesis monooxygenase [Nakamurella antarctica]|uniref:Antibiotic biosynthesis monooxygenase n=1 Tax=Nakamurella antarctica TaxID=1902245 RepID=A0A3G8ZW55_9ACTN|nr:antibiotic biosynthesis monooxygenase [Nakamurella antarctica]AZI58246.1 antibiotic biosynthesis monooxygenase [Nakamurella antarctica]
MTVELICRFTDVDDEFVHRARRAVALLAAQEMCIEVRLSRSTEDPRSFALTAEFDSFTGYRRSLSPFDVRTVVIPFLSEAQQSESAVLEVLMQSRDGVLSEPEVIVDPNAVQPRAAAQAP